MGARLMAILRGAVCDAFSFCVTLFLRQLATRSDMAMASARRLVLLMPLSPSLLTGGRLVPINNAAQYVSAMVNTHEFSLSDFARSYREMRQYEAA